MVRSNRGVALVIVLALLALLVLAVYALSALVRVNSQVAASSVQQLQARQNALVALNIALAELQKAAGPDARVTGIAGITGIAANANSSTRHWCGVWREDGSFITWLVSAAQSSTPALVHGVTGVELVGTAAVGAAAANSEHVMAGKLPIPDASGTPIGAYAYLVLDEGVKTSAYTPSPVAIPPVIFANTTNAQSRLRDALASYSSRLPRISSYEQLALLPAPANPLTASTIQDNLHHVALTARWVVGDRLLTGYTNVNTNSVIVWRNLLQTYNASPAAPARIPAATLSARGTAIQNSVAGFSAAGKAANGPFTTVSAVSSLLASAFTSGNPTAVQLYSALAPQLSVRSDTFRIRAYGDTLDATDPTQVVAAAYCEAIVQRTPETAPDGQGRRFVIASFRWLGPGDI